MRFLFISFFLFTAISSQAQKIGYMNLGNLMAELPEVKSANAEIESLNKSYESIIQKMADNLQANFAKLSQQNQGGELSPKQLEEKQKALDKQRSELLAKEQELSGKLQQKRQELLSPILNKIENTVQAYAQENGYSMILDSSIPNFLLFAEDGEDLTEIIRAKL